MQTVWLLSSIIEREEGWEEKGISTKGADSGQEEWEEDVEGKEIIKEKREKRSIFLPQPIPAHPKSTLQLGE